VKIAHGGYSEDQDISEAALDEQVIAIDGSETRDN